MGVGSHRASGRRCTGGRGTPGSEDVAGREAVTYVRGAVTAKVQGHNWVPIPSTDHMVNVGTPLPVPASLYPGAKILENVPRYTTNPFVSMAFNEGSDSPSNLSSP